MFNIIFIFISNLGSDVQCIVDYSKNFLMFNIICNIQLDFDF